MPWERTVVSKYILVIRADRSVRIARRPRFAADEVGVELMIRFPGEWGRTIATLDITAPEFTPTVEYKELEEPNADQEQGEESHQPAE